MAGGRLMWDLLSHMTDFYSVLTEMYILMIWFSIQAAVVSKIINVPLQLSGIES